MDQRMDQDDDGGGARRAKIKRYAIAVCPALAFLLYRVVFKSSVAEVKVESWADVYETWSSGGGQSARSSPTCHYRDGHAHSSLPPPPLMPIAGANGTNVTSGVLEGRRSLSHATSKYRTFNPATIYRQYPDTTMPSGQNSKLCPFLPWPPVKGSREDLR